MCKLLLGPPGVDNDGCAMLPSYSVPNHDSPSEATNSSAIVKAETLQSAHDAQRIEQISSIPYGYQKQQR